MVEKIKQFENGLKYEWTNEQNTVANCKQVQMKEQTEICVWMADNTNKNRTACYLSIH